MGYEFKAAVTLAEPEIASLRRAIDGDSRYALLSDTTAIRLCIVRMLERSEWTEDVHILCETEILVTFLCATRAERETLLEFLASVLATRDRSVQFEET